MVEVSKFQELKFQLSPTGEVIHFRSSDTIGSNFENWNETDETEKSKTVSNCRCAIRMF